MINGGQNIDWKGSQLTCDLPTSEEKEPCHTTPFHLIQVEASGLDLPAEELHYYPCRPPETSDPRVSEATPGMLRGTY